MLRKLIGLSVLLWALPLQAMQVTVTIPPLAGLVAPLLDEDDQLTVLLQPGASPHGFQIKPSHLWLLQKTDLVVSVGTPVDAWIEKPMQHHAMPHLQMSQLAGIAFLPMRQGGVWEKHAPHAAAETHADAHHEEHVEHGEMQHELDGDAHVHETDSRSLHRPDGHIWLSMHNAQVLVKALSLQLQALQPNKAQHIQQRTQAWLNRLSQVDADIQTQLTPVKEQPFIVLHDAYQYFEKRYQLNGVGSIRLNPEIAPSIKRIQAIRHRMQEQKVKCVFKEPQFPEKRVSAVVSGLQVRMGSLDPIGINIQDAKGSQGFVPYDQLLLNLAHAFYQCLAAKSSKER
ncbi:zinc ABC transporter substrate-binding protein [Thiomicrorhabdus sp. zzn3]|uniref:zinc ABC transporter substrate-binding protein n=1 Tax=Thiomicrorhabdus sp. zzn3 TaxID=3039775 RepID=UPI002436B4E8|nr:zinc ABC transporter substrate-binding protein [Thiomicrorhabdus sp. zzn3]MDG6778493.1 zinc ABC transporter substrate-binding protein [Thiomicrorhabdus sp. zzn3]